jgi:type IV secretory pathway VirB2 component (pilin)
MSDLHLLASSYQGPHAQLVALILIVGGGLALGFIYLWARSGNRRNKQ